jgi:hypothetical protein
MKNIFVVFSFALLVLYSISAYLSPRYFSNEVLLVDDSELQSQQFVANLIQSVNEDETLLTKEVVVQMIRSADTSGNGGYHKVHALIDLIEQHAIVLFCLLLFHFGALLGLVRTKNET